MLLRSGFNYDINPFFFNKNSFFEYLNVNISGINEVDLIFINDFCNIISKINLSNQIDKIQYIGILYSLIYDNRDSIVNIYNYNNNFVDFIIVMYDKSNTFINNIIELIPEYKKSSSVLLQTLYYLHKSKHFIETEFNI